MTEDFTPTEFKTFYLFTDPKFPTTDDRVRMRMYYDALIAYKNDKNEMKRNTKRHEKISAELIAVKEWLTRESA